MAQERSEKKLGFCSIFKARFWPKKDTQSELAQALRTTVNDRPEYSTVSNDQSKSGSTSDENAADLSTKLWSDAYENMRDGPEREMIITYEKVLTQLASDGTGGTNGKPFALNPSPNF